MYYKHVLLYHSNAKPIAIAKFIILLILINLAVIYLLKGMDVTDPQKG